MFPNQFFGGGGNMNRMAGTASDFGRPRLLTQQNWSWQQQQHLNQQQAHGYWQQQRGQLSAPAHNAFFRPRWGMSGARPLLPRTPLDQQQVRGAQPVQQVQARMPAERSQIHQRGQQQEQEQRNQLETVQPEPGWHPSNQQEVHKQPAQQQRAEEQTQLQAAPKTSNESTFQQSQTLEQQQTQFPPQKQVEQAETQRSQVPLQQQQPAQVTEHEAQEILPPPQQPQQAGQHQQPNQTQPRPFIGPIKPTPQKDPDPSEPIVQSYNTTKQAKSNKSGSTESKGSRASTSKEKNKEKEHPTKVVEPLFQVGHLDPLSNLSESNNEPAKSKRVRKRRPGDWDCGVCYEENFAFRKECYGCKQRREQCEQGRKDEIPPQQRQAEHLRQQERGHVNVQEPHQGPRDLGQREREEPHWHHRELREQQWQRQGPQWSEQEPQWSEQGPQWSEHEPQWSEQGPQWSEQHPHRELQRFAGSSMLSNRERGFSSGEPTHNSYRNQPHEPRPLLYNNQDSRRPFGREESFEPSELENSSNQEVLERERFQLVMKEREFEELFVSWENSFLKWREANNRLLNTNRTVGRQNEELHRVRERLLDKRDMMLQGRRIMEQSPSFRRPNDSEPMSVSQERRRGEEVEILQSRSLGNKSLNNMSARSQETTNRLLDNHPGPAPDLFERRPRWGRDEQPDDEGNSEERGYGHPPPKKSAKVIDYGHTSTSDDNKRGEEDRYGLLRGPMSDDQDRRSVQHLPRNSRTNAPEDRHADSGKGSSRGTYRGGESTFRNPRDQDSERSHYDTRGNFPQHRHQQERQVQQPRPNPPPVRQLQQELGPHQQYPQRHLPPQGQHQNQTLPPQNQPPPQQSQERELQEQSGQHQQYRSKLTSTPSVVEVAGPVGHPPQDVPPDNRVIEGKTLPINDLLRAPGRFIRPPRIVIIFRGLPGSGKSYIAKNIKAVESLEGSDVPRILALDEYFIVDGQYEYEGLMEPAYRMSLIKSFKKTCDDGLFTFIMVDCVNELNSHYMEMWSYAKKRGFEVYVAQMECEVEVAMTRNIHNRKPEDIEKMAAAFEETPTHVNKLDLSTLIQDQAIRDVQMTDADEEKDGNDDAIQITHEQVDAASNKGTTKSKWEVMDNEEQLDQLDGLSSKTRGSRVKLTGHDSIEEWLHTNKNTDNNKGVKRVRWADIEERRAQLRLREIGFVVGQDYWQRTRDPKQGQDALISTKFIPNRFGHLEKP